MPGGSTAYSVFGLLCYTADGAVPVLAAGESSHRETPAKCNPGIWSDLEPEDSSWMETHSMQSDWRWPGDLAGSDGSGKLGNAS